MKSYGLRYVEEFGGRDLVSGLAFERERVVNRPISLMEVCGTHTMAVARHGLRDLFPAGLRLVSGPGCPVCVTSAGDIDAFIEIALTPGVIAAVFGDLLRVPGASGSLSEARSRGARVEVVYSPMDALELAADERKDLVVFIGVGFETTTPAIAATILEAARRRLGNFCVYASNKLMPPVLDALFSDPDLKIQGVLCPGHVSAIIGAQAYEPLVTKYGIACVIAGFEPADIIGGLIRLVVQVDAGMARVENCYPRVVTREGNQQARDLMFQVFEPVDAKWRGLGTIPGSGLAIRSRFKAFDASHRLGIKTGQVREPEGCRCGDVLMGRLVPLDCPLFARRCTPLRPVGPCMVSSEGACAAYYRTEGNRSTKSSSI